MGIALCYDKDEQMKINFRNYVKNVNPGIYYGEDLNSVGYNPEKSPKTFHPIRTRFPPEVLYTTRSVVAIP